MKFFLEILLLIIAIVIFSFLFFYSAEILISLNSQQSPSGYPLGRVCMKGNCFSVELATTEAQREQGLIYRKELDKNKGMLFIFDKEDIYPFWMKNTLIPLDMIWIDSNNKVVFISQNVQPCLPAQAGKSLICPSVVPQTKAKYVLEINAGICEQINLKLGDEIKLNIL